MLEKVNTRKKKVRKENNNFRFTVYNLTVIGHIWKQAAPLERSMTGGMLINIAMNHQYSMHK